MARPAAQPSLAVQVAYNELLALAAAVEATSEHPLARAVLEHAASRLAPHTAAAAAPAGRLGSLDAELGEALGDLGQSEASDGELVRANSVKLPARQTGPSRAWLPSAKDCETFTGARCISPSCLPAVRRLSPESPTDPSCGADWQRKLHVSVLGRAVTPAATLLAYLQA